MEKGVINNKIYVVGHKNPDTDSVCSAIAYAQLRTELTGERHNARRAGQLNEETQYVLDYFNVKAPALLTDLRVQVKDVAMREVEGMRGSVSIKSAWARMKEENLKTLPVTRDGKLEGLITIGDTATSYMDVYDSTILATSRTQYRNIATCIEGEIVTGNPHSYMSNGKVGIVASSRKLMAEFVEPEDLVILGNRKEVQQMAIDMGVSCMIVSTGAELDEGILEQAKEKEIVIITTEQDTFTVARLINQSIPIRHFMSGKDGLVSFKMRDYVDDVKEVMMRNRFRDFPVLDNKGKFLGFISRRRLLNCRKKQVILVDHNEASQTVDGIEHADILEIIDHHRIGTLETLEPVFFRNQPLGCTATIVYQMYQENGIEIPKSIAGLLMAAILSDTLMFRSPTCTAVDQAAAERLSELCGVEIEEFSIDMFSAGSDMGSKTPAEIFNQDKKKFQVNEHEFIVAQINSMNSIELDEIKEKLVPYLNEEFGNLGVEMCYVMLTNIVKEKTELLCFGEHAKEVARSAFQLPEDTVDIRLKGLVSRKKQLIPSIVTVLQQ